MTTACSALPGGGKGPAGEATSKEDTLARARQQGYITVGFANEKPFAYKTPDGKVTGEAVETARAAFAAMGIKDTKSGVPLDRMVIVPEQPAALAAVEGRAGEQHHHDRPRPAGLALG